MRRATLRGGTEPPSRISDGVHVRLLWHSFDRRATVDVTDCRSGAECSMEVRGRDRALDVFHHPFAYAAWRGVDTTPGLDAVA